MLKYILAYFTATKAAFTTSCYTNSSTVFGYQLGTSTTDLTTIERQFAKLTDKTRSAAVNQCVELSTASTNGRLLGLQVGVVDYSQIVDSIPTESELIWLPGIGNVTPGIGVTCTKVYIANTAGI